MLIILQKEMMVVKNQVGHVRAERDVLATAEDDNRWLTVLHYSFSDETHLYMVMEYLPGGDLMSLLMREDTFSEEATKFFMENAYMAELPARREALRGTFDPGYLNYTLGKLMILKLREDYRREQGNAYSLKEFHDKLLSFGGPAFPLLRPALLKDPGRDAI